MTSNQRKVVMISSTARDLPEHREQVRLACIRAGFEPREMMEHLTAEDASAVDVSLRMVEDADVYLSILAYRYGTIPPGFDVSITEMEYDRAVKLDKPRLIFFIHKDHPVTIAEVDTGPSAAKLEALKKRIGDQRVAASFRSPEDLRAHVIEALIKLREKLDAAEPGDVIAKSAAALHRITSIPAPPDSYIAHPYTLLRSRDLVGRQAELNALTDWIANPRSQAFGAHVFCFVAIGGMGKSALTWKWFNQIAPNEMKPLAGRMWWSFYESDATFENFMNRALCYVSGQSEEEVRRLPWQEREAQLLQHLNDKPYLIALDGLERILIAYNRMDASRLADDDYDQQTANWVTGAAGLPASAAQSFVGQYRLRDTTDPRAGAFLQKLAQTKSRILITTRLYPRALQLPTGYPRPGCFAYFLRGLSDDDALGLWRALNVSGSRAELLPIFHSVGSHPLLLQALAGEIAKYRNAPGNFAQWRADHPQFDPTSLSLVQSRTHILEFALRNLSANVRGVLHTIVTFRMPASYATLEALLVGPDKACHSVQDLDRALTELEDRGLIGWDREANRYDAHPIVRGVVSQLADVKYQRDVYTAIAAHFEPMAVPNYLKVESLADLTPAIERYHTLVSLERYDDASALFRNQIFDATHFRLAAFRENIAWLERLFPHDLAALPPLTSESGHSQILNALALSYQFSGQPSRAIPLFQKCIAISERLESNDANRQVILANISDALGEAGTLRLAISNARRSLILARKLKREFHEGVTLYILGGLLGAVGDHVLANLALDRSVRLSVVGRWLQLEGTASAIQAECALWIGSFAKAGVCADRAWELAAVQRIERDFIRAALLQGRVALCQGNVTRADERFHHALARARASNVVESELRGLIAIAELEFQRDHLAEARSHLNDVWEAAERGCYPLRLADASNVLAAIAIAEGDKPAGMAAAINAYKAAWCDGPPYAYHWGLQKAKAHLAALGAPEPVMPPFDESKFPPMPEVEINPKDEYWIDPDKLD